MIPEGFGTLTPRLISRDSAALIRVLDSAFGAEEIAGSRMHKADWKPRTQRLGKPSVRARARSPR
jgi:hypothetical protein